MSDQPGWWETEPEVHFVSDRPLKSPEGLLCVRSGENSSEEISARSKHPDGWIMVTIDPDQVTCPQCLEWMHS